MTLVDAHNQGSETSAIYVHSGHICNSQIPHYAVLTAHGPSPQATADAFGVAVADGLRALSKDKAVPKAEQMADSLRRIQEQPREVWIVKLADRAVNMEPAPAHWSMDKRRTYQPQASTILEQLGSASPSLAERLREKIARYEACISAP